MSYVVYKLIHFFGITAVIAVLAATCMHAFAGGTRASNPFRRVFGATHGVAVFLILLGGFGMLARLDVMHGALPRWVYLKLAIWLVLGLAIALPYRARVYARTVLLALPVLMVLAAAIALYKP